MADVIITGNVQTVSGAGLTTPAVTVTSSVATGVTLQGALATGGIGPVGPTGESPITVSSTAPSSPVLDALWVDTA